MNFCTFISSSSSSGRRITDIRHFSNAFTLRDIYNFKNNRDTENW